jgi:hypothetical protein
LDEVVSTTIATLGSSTTSTKLVTSKVTGLVTITPAPVTQVQTVVVPSVQTQTVTPKTVSQIITVLSTQISTSTSIPKGQDYETQKYFNGTAKTHGSFSSSRLDPDYHHPHNERQDKYPESLYHNIHLIYDNPGWAYGDSQCKEGIYFLYPRHIRRYKNKQDPVRLSHAFLLRPNSSGTSKVRTSSKDLFEGIQVPLHHALLQL